MKTRIFIYTLFTSLVMMVTGVFAAIGAALGAGRDLHGHRAIHRFNLYFSSKSSINHANMLARKNEITLPRKVFVGLYVNLNIEVTLIAVGGCLTMLTNDYIDRDNDTKKGKTFVKEHEKLFFKIVTIGWIAVTTISYLLYYPLASQNLLLLSLIVIGIGYSFARHITFLPTLLVAGAGASPILFGFIENHTDAAFFSFIIVFVFMLASEILKDCADAESDEGYKTTLITGGICSKKEAYYGSAVLYLASITFMDFLTGMLDKHTSLNLAGMILMAMSLTLMILVPNRFYRLIERGFDIGSAIVLISLLV